MQENIQPPQSHFIWQPILLLAVIVYLIAELYFLTAMVNTLDSGIRSSDFRFMEHLGRFISGAGIGLSVIIGLSINCKMYQFPKGQRIVINVLVFTLCTLVGYFAVKSLYEVIEANTSKPIIHCSVLGNSAIRALDRGELPGFEQYGKKTLTSDSNNGLSFNTLREDSLVRQLIRLYLPLHICLNDEYRRTLQASTVIRDELSAMVKETQLPERLAKPAVQMYVGFREQLPRFSAEIARLDALNSEASNKEASNTEASNKEASNTDTFDPSVLNSDMLKDKSINNQRVSMFAMRDEFINTLETQLNSQSRYTKSDVGRIVAIYVCALDTAIAKANNQAYEQRFMWAVTDCLYDRARTRFKTLPVVKRAVDVYDLEDAIAHDWARQFILSPQHMPEKALDLMRQSFALVFLPTYAVFISTFVVFMCLAAYFRTRFLIRASKSNIRVNPVINAMLSPLVVVPGIWTLIFLWVPEPEVESQLFPVQTQSHWVKVIKVTIRPLFHYYPYTHAGFTGMNIPLFITPKLDDASFRQKQRAERARNSILQSLKGYYVGEICQSHCEPVVLDLKNGNAEFAHIRYPERKCQNRLIYDKSNQSKATFYESTKNKNDCPVIGVWQLSVLDNGLEVTIGDKGREQQTVLKNLYI